MKYLTFKFAEWFCTKKAYSRWQFAEKNTPRRMEKVIMMLNLAGNDFQTYINE